jgi:ribose transport system ATP-binding protein
MEAGGEPQVGARRRAPGSSPALLSIESLAKSFGGTRALDAFSLEIRPSEVHGLVGQNGSGKSTVIKILSGYHHPDAGRVRIRGEDVKLPLKPSELRDLGIEFVHQDLGLVGTMSILENLRVGRYSTGRLGRIRWRAERRGAVELIRRFELDVDIDSPVERLSKTEQAIVAIMRALQNVEERGASGLLVLDEPTASLPKHEIHRLFDAIGRIAAEGSSVLIVTHNLEEVFEITDRVTVLRDGRPIATSDTAELDERSLIELIVGRKLGELYPSHEHSATDVAMKVTDLAGGVARQVSFVARRGEIVGLTGLVGAGHDEVPYLLAGAQPARSGEIRVDGGALAHGNPERAQAAGVVLLPADRQRQSAILRASVKENVTLPALKSFRGRLGLDHRTERAAVREVLERFEVTPSDLDRPMSTLSGGNQQKALLGRCLRMSPRVLVLHEPTQGVDVGARGAIFAILERAAEEETAIVYSSVEYEELAHLCDRALIFRSGQIIAELSGEELTQEALVAHCYQTAAA